MYPNLPEWDKDAASFLCADLTFLYAILTRGLNMSESTGFTLVRCGPAGAPAAGGGGGGGGGAQTQTYTNTQAHRDTQRQTHTHR
jgi:hypothetical protein